MVLVKLLYNLILLWGKVVWLKKFCCIRQTLMNIGNYEYNDVFSRLIVDREERQPEILD